MGETIFSHANFAFSSICFSLVKIQPYLPQVFWILIRQEIIPKHLCAPPSNFAFVRFFFFINVRLAAPNLYICLKFAQFSPDEKLSLKHLCAPPADFAFVRSFFFVSVRRCAADPISIQPHLAFISKW